MMHFAGFLLPFIGVGLTVLTLPLIVELATLTFASLWPRRMTPSVADSSELRLAVIVPAHNEEILIRTCVESLKASAVGSNSRIIVVAHNCSDRTASRAKQAGAEVLMCNEPHATGKGAALTAGFAYATAEGFNATLVVDADSTVSPNLIDEVSGALGNGADATQCRYEMESSATRPATRLTALAFRGFNVVRATGRARLGLSAGIVGNGFALRQELLQENSYKSHSVVEDLELHLRLVLAGKHVQFLEDAKVTSSLPGSKQGEATQRSRWEGGRANAARTWFLPLAGKLIRGRIRLLEPMLDLISMPIGYAVFLLLLAACFPLVWLRGYALVALAVVGCHVVAAARCGPDFPGDLRVLLRVPGYIGWKLMMLPSLLRSARPEASWVRTEREAA